MSAGLLRGLVRTAREAWLHATGRGARAEQEADARALAESETWMGRARAREPFLRYREQVEAWKVAFDDALRARERLGPYRGTDEEAKPLPALPFSPSPSPLAWDRLWDNVAIMKLHDEAERWRAERLARSVKIRDRG